MIYTVGSIKGGSGKTTVATSLTVLLAASGRDVLLVDADEQESATDFTAWRNESTGGNAGYTTVQLTENAVRTEVLQLCGKYDDVVIDVGGRDTISQRAALVVSDIFLIPFVPRALDVWTYEKVARLVEEMQPANPKLKAYAFLNRADPRGADNDEACELLKESEAITFLDTPLGYRKAFSNAAAQGMAVTELKPVDPKAVAELMALFKRLIDVGITSDKRQKRVEVA